ncbi:TRAP transporter large permease [Acuticoccus mangrovi]|uniref:TRAP transporter large permease protein n=1 Tax=Acuticoccus mangrovi TaxID=2796142 RepID=A0A934IM92_9HYPH|nr:TRAP transporter large permease [Acuticoccus mangrovi]MBJ3774953.1 TRAP transporter large permease [Acuticoccus mangrovi]
MPIPFLIATAFVVLIIGSPIFLAILGPTFITFELFAPPIPAMVLPQRMVDGVNKFSLLAIPLFIFAADIIARGQIGARLVAMVESFCGHLRGGLAIATIIACALFGAMSGIGPAAVVSIGPIVYPALIRQGYSRGFAVGLIVTSSTLAMLIPPSVAMILYALQTNTSIGAVFLAGLGSGFVFSVVLCIYAYLYARRYNIAMDEKAPWSLRWKRTKEAAFALGLPVIILGGIYGGAFTPTEAAAFACVYAMMVEVLIYRQLSFKDLFNISSASAGTISVLLILVASGTVLTYYLTLSQIPQQVTSTLAGASAFEILLIINVLFLIAGMFVDPNSLIIVLTPLIYRAALAAGIDPVHLGSVIVANVALGMVSPPFGLNLFIGITTFRASYLEVVKAVLPFIGLMLIVLLLITYIPQISLFLPQVIG